MGNCLSKKKKSINIIIWNEILDFHKKKLQLVKNPMLKEINEIEDELKIKMKPLIDYLEVNTRKIKWISKKIKVIFNNYKNNGVSHIIIWILFKIIIQNIEKFKYDPNITKKLIKRKNKNDKNLIKNNILIEKYFFNNLMFFENKLIIISRYLLTFYSDKKSEFYNLEFSKEISNLIFKILLSYKNNVSIFTENKIGNKVLFILTNVIENTLLSDLENEELNDNKIKKINKILAHLYTIINGLDFEYFIWLWQKILHFLILTFNSLYKTKNEMINDQNLLEEGINNGNKIIEVISNKLYKNKEYNNILENIINSEFIKKDDYQIIIFNLFNQSLKQTKIQSNIYNIETEILENFLKNLNNDNKEKIFIYNLFIHFIDQSDVWLKNNFNKIKLINYLIHIDVEKSKKILNIIFYKISNDSNNFFLFLKTYFDIINKLKYKEIVLYVDILLEELEDFKLYFNNKSYICNNLIKKIISIEHNTDEFLFRKLEIMCLILKFTNNFNNKLIYLNIHNKLLYIIINFINYIINSKINKEDLDQKNDNMGTKEIYDFEKLILINSIFIITNNILSRFEPNILSIILSFLFNMIEMLENNNNINQFIWIIYIIYTFYLISKYWKIYSLLNYLDTFESLLKDKAGILILNLLSNSKFDILKYDEIIIILKNKVGIDFDLNSFKINLKEIIGNFLKENEFIDYEEIELNKEIVFNNSILTVEINNKENNTNSSYFSEDNLEIWETENNINLSFETESKILLNQRMISNKLRNLID